MMLVTILILFLAPLSLATTHLPLYRTSSRALEKRNGQYTAIGLGDYLDITYNVLVEIGNTRAPLVLDTGSSDLWLASDSCAGDCLDAGIALYSSEQLQSTGLDVRLFYGDSRTGTHASGPIGLESVGIANLSQSGQVFAAINDTNSTIFQTNSAGILGLGFPPISVIWRQLLQAQLASASSPVSKRSPLAPFPTNITAASIGQPPFPSFDFLSTTHSSRKRRRSNQSPLFSSASVLSSFAAYGPLFSRLIMQQALERPLVATTLQRDTLQIGGDVGSLSLGGLPEGIQDNQLTWVPVRAYSVDEGGLPPSPEAPNEVYPLVWEIAIDEVFFDGLKLPRSALVSPAISISGLVDTGNSLIRGPRDIVNHIIQRFGGPDYAFDCGEAHNLTFQIGSVLFPVDPRDFAQPLPADSPGPERCTAALAVTDPPGNGGFLYSWSLGDPFLKSALIAYYYGNLTHPSQDPPRIGLLSTVPANAADQLRQATRIAVADGGVFPAITQAAPSGTYVATTTGPDGVPQASHSDIMVLSSTSAASSPASRTHIWTISCAMGLSILAMLL